MDLNKYLLNNCFQRKHEHTFLDTQDYTKIVTKPRQFYSNIDMTSDVFL